jgi:hypothetical protein
MSDAYEVTLGPAAVRFVLAVSPKDRADLADALRQELASGGPNSEKEFRFDSYGSAVTSADPGAPDSAVYTATPISFRGCTVIHRQMAVEELMRLSREQGRSTARRGIYVIDILSAESAFHRSVARRD